MDNKIFYRLQMLCLIGESFDGESVLVNGAVVNVRNRVSCEFTIYINLKILLKRGTKFPCGSARPSPRNLSSKLAKL